METQSSNASEAIPKIVSKNSYSQMPQTFGKALNPLFEGGDAKDDIISDDDNEMDR